MSDDAHSSKRAAPGRPFQPGVSGNPGGRAALPPEVREALRADTIPRYLRLKELSKMAEENGDLKTAAHIELQLLKKQIPDLSSIEVTGEGGGPLQLQRIDTTKLSAEDLLTIRAIQAKSQK